MAKVRQVSHAKMADVNMKKKTTIQSLLLSCWRPKGMQKYWGIILTLWHNLVLKYNSPLNVWVLSKWLSKNWSETLAQVWTRCLLATCAVVMIHVIMISCSCPKLEQRPRSRSQYFLCRCVNLPKMGNYLFHKVLSCRINHSRDMIQVIEPAKTEGAPHRAWWSEEHFPADGLGS